MATDTTVKQVLALLATNYPEQVAKLSEAELTMRRQLFVQALADIDDDMLKAAALRHVTTSPWFPKISELRSAAVAVTQPAMPDPMEAWGAVLAEIRRTGFYGVPCFADPLTAAVVKQMGWKDLCLSEDATADRARFVDAYARQSQRAREQQVMPLGLRDGAMTTPPDHQLEAGNGAQALIRQLAEARRV
jgi:hypothetical protein